ncbi:MAG: hypothetical protein NT023_12325 [Armatimonadetes bacterium]|nr:hypothetical protein [Armatimonadota bacterium]
MPASPYPPPHSSADAKALFLSPVDHQRFGEDIQACRHQWMITYDDAAELRARFAWANQHRWKL